MKLVIGNMDQKMRSFIKKCEFKERMMMINKMCNVKTIHEEVDVIVPFGIVMDSGIISDTLVHLEELIISVKVRKIFYTNPYNRDKMKYFEDSYQVETKYIDINQVEQHFEF